MYTNTTYWLLIQLLLYMIWWYAYVLIHNSLELMTHQVPAVEQTIPTVVVLVPTVHQKSTYMLNEINYLFKLQADKA